MVGGCASLCEVLRLEAAVCHIVAVEHLVVELLLQCERTERAAQQFFGERLRLLLELAVGGKPRRQPQTKRLLAVDARAQRHQLNRLRESDDLLQMVDAACIARQPDTGERREQTALLRHDTEIRAKRDAAARTCRCAVHHRDDGLRAAAQSERCLARQDREVVADEVERCHLLDVAACREILA